MRQPVRVVLADDHDAFIEGLGMVLSAEDDLEVVATTPIPPARHERDDSLELRVPHSRTPYLLSS
jgi:hypothetical protein